MAFPNRTLLITELFKYNYCNIALLTAKYQELLNLVIHKNASK